MGPSGRRHPGMRSDPSQCDHHLATGRGERLDLLLHQAPWHPASLAARGQRLGMVPLHRRLEPRQATRSEPSGPSTSERTTS